jgi:hypothetical protein
VRLIHRVPEGGFIPRGYGFVRGARYEFAMDFAPIPLNFALGAWHWIYWKVLVRGFGYKRDELASIQRTWKDRGYNQGYDAGYDAGIRHAAILRGE